MPPTSRAKRLRKHDRFLAILLGICLVIIGAYLQMLWVAEKAAKSAGKIPRTVQEVACGACSGTGWVRDAMHPTVQQPCPTCFGLGSRTILGEQQGRSVCPTCVGMGRRPRESDGVVDTCPTCQGWGLVQVRTYRETLPLISQEPPPPPYPPDPTNQVPQWLLRP